MADFLASPGFVTCTVAAAHDGSADSLLAFTELVNEDPASSRCGFGVWQELVLFGLKEL